MIFLKNGKYVILTYLYIFVELQHQFDLLSNFSIADFWSESRKCDDILKWGKCGEQTDIRTIASIMCAELIDQINLLEDYWLVSPSSPAKYHIESILTLDRFEREM